MKIPNDPVLSTPSGEPMEKYPTHPLDYAGVRSGLASEAVTWRSIVVELRKRAGEHYAAGRDKEAQLLRELAKEWEPREAEARTRQAKYESEYEPSETVGV